MKTWILLLVVSCLALLGQEYRLTTPSGTFIFTRTDRGQVLLNIAAKNAEKQSGSIVILTNATMTTKILNISADEMKYNEETGEAELRGNVHVKISK